MKKITELAQAYLQTKLNQHDIAVDFTCGSGQDTYFLSQLVSEVHSYDIQEEALNEAKRRCALCSNVHFHHKSHLYFDEDITSFRGGIFNLGYYPKGNHSITTQAEIVIPAIEKALCCLQDKGVLVIVCYPLFTYGAVEAKQIEDYLQTLPAKSWDVFRFQLVNRKGAPYILGIEKH